MSGAPLPASITRRDFLDGVALALAAPFAGAAAAPAAASADDPPARTGLQGQTDAAMSTAHAWRDNPARWRDATPQPDAGIEDLEPGFPVQALTTAGT